MSERCDTIQELLPWLLNGTLTSEETVMTLNHVMECTVCKQELAFLASTQRTAAAKWHSTPDPAFSDSLWSRIQEGIHHEEVMNVAPSSGWSTDTKTRISRTLFPFVPAYHMVRSVYQSVSNQLLHVFSAILPGLNTGSRS